MSFSSSFGGPVCACSAPMAKWKSTQGHAMLGSVSIMLNERFQLTACRGQGHETCVGASILDVAHPSDRSRVVEFVNRIGGVRRVVHCDFVGLLLRDERDLWSLRGVRLPDGRAILLHATPQ